MKDVLIWILVIPFFILCLSWIDDLRTEYYDSEVQKEHEKRKWKFGLYILIYGSIIGFIGWLFNI